MHFCSCNITIINYWKDCWYWWHLWYCAKAVSATIHYQGFNGKEPYNLCMRFCQARISLCMKRHSQPYLIHVMNMIRLQGDQHLLMYWRLDVLSFDICHGPLLFIDWLLVGNGRWGGGQMPMVCIFTGGQMSYILFILRGKCPPLPIIWGANVRSCHFSWEGKCPGGF